MIKYLLLLALTLTAFAADAPTLTETQTKDLVIAYQKGIIAQQAFEQSKLSFQSAMNNWAATQDKVREAAHLPQGTQFIVNLDTSTVTTTPPAAPKESK